MLLLRGITTGGSSVFYCGTAFDPPFEMLESHGIDIRKEIDELKKEIPIEPLSDELMGPMANRMRSSAQDLGYDWQKINKFIFQDKCKAGCWRCAYGCPYDAKWTARNFVERGGEERRHPGERRQGEIGADRRETRPPASNSRSGAGHTGSRRRRSSWGPAESARLKF